MRMLIILLLAVLLQLSDHFSFHESKFSKGIQAPKVEYSSAAIITPPGLEADRRQHHFHAFLSSSTISFSSLGRELAGLEPASSYSSL